MSGTISIKEIIQKSVKLSLTLTGTLLNCDKEAYTIFSDVLEIATKEHIPLKSDTARTSVSRCGKTCFKTCFKTWFLPFVKYKKKCCG